MISNTNFPNSYSPSLPAQVTKGTPQHQVDKVAKDMEKTIWYMTLKPLFESIKTDGPFGGGIAVEQMRSFLVEQVASQMNGINIAPHIKERIIALQEVRG